MTRRGAIRLTAVAILLLHFADAKWWQLGMPNAFTTNSIDSAPDGQQKSQCENVSDYLGETQRNICIKGDKHLLAVIGQGAKLGIEECQHQFRFSRWNCTTFPENSTLFGNALNIKSRESAYLHAISAASLAHTLTRACTKGDLSAECSCDHRVRQRKPRSWQWGGCSEDIQFGERFSKEFLDGIEDRESSAGLMNLHNNEAGRRSVRTRMHKMCKCHGMSGSCSMKVCWRRLPPLRQVGEALFQGYEGAAHVKMVEGKRKRKLRVINPDMKRPNKTDLLYLEDSPDYCEKNETLGIMGTKGRLCNRTSHGLDGCRLLCCGRGYQTRVRQVEEKCNCRFKWCCDVLCEMCKYQKEEHICN